MILTEPLFKHKVANIYGDLLLTASRNSNIWVGIENEQIGGFLIQNKWKEEQICIWEELSGALSFQIGKQITGKILD